MWQKIKNTIKTIFDFILAPFTYLSCLWFLIIRRQGVNIMKVSKKIFMNVGIFPIRDHYYEPLFNSKYLKYSLRKERVLPGVDFNINEQLEILNKFHFNDELLKFPIQKTNKLEFYHYNGAFQFGDPEYLYNIIRLFKPHKIIEIGSGYSTLMAINSIKKNKEEDPNYTCEFICMEPYENRWLEKLNIKIIRKCVEEINKNIFLELNSNDILSIDSSHIIRPQGDVLFEYLEILPILKSGVLVHIHDIYTPRDYCNKWVIDETRFFNEQYLLEAFLTFNKEYKVIGSLNYLMHNYFSQFSSCCPMFMLKNETNIEPGSFWIMKR